VWQSHAHANGDTDGYCYCHGYRHSDSDANGNFYGHGNSHCYGNSHRYGYSGAEGYSDTATSSDTTAPTVRLVDRRSVIVSCFGNSRANLASSLFCHLSFVTAHLLCVAGRNFRSTRSEPSSRPAAEP